MSVAGLAEACKEAGAPELTTPSITNLERPASAARPRRRASVEEWLALAHVLQVPPVALLLPLSRPAGEVELVPGIESPVEQALAWLTATAPQGLDGREPEDLSPWHSITHLRGWVAVRGVDAPELGRAAGGTDG